MKQTLYIAANQLHYGVRLASGYLPDAPELTVVEARSNSFGRVIRVVAYSDEQKMYQWDEEPLHQLPVIVDRT